MRWPPPLILVAALAVIGVAGCARGDGPAAALPPGTNAVVERVVDGDTVHVRLVPGDRAETVRLIGVDTPETKDPRRPVQCFGEEASAFTTRTLPRGEALRLELDTEARDRYGRLLAYVHRARDGLFVNLALAEEGYAQPLTIAPNVAHADAFVAAARRAREDGRGLWRQCR